MPVTYLSNPRKRQHSEPLAPQQNKTSHTSKRQKRSHPLGFPLPSAFWDNLSKIDLTNRALKELDRRNTRAALHSQRPVTRYALAKRRKRFRPLTPAVEYLCSCGTKDRKNIKQTARHGGPALSDLRGCPEPSRPDNPAMNSSRSSSRDPKRKSTSTSRIRPSTNTTNTTSTASTGPYNRNFQQNLIDGGIYPHAYKYPDGRMALKPDNWTEINRRLSQPRPSLSPSKFSEDAHEKFVQADAHASKEKQVTTSVIPIIEGDIGDPKCVSGGIPFTNLDHLTDGTLVPGNPDIYYGARPEQLNRRVRDELSRFITPSTQTDMPMAPNFFVAVKGPDGSAAVAKRQATYDGALGARGMHILRSYGQEKLYDNNAYTITSTYHDGTLKMYTSYPTQPVGPEIQPEYHMHQVKGWSMTSDRETFRQGATYYRNGMDWAKEQRDQAIRHANRRVDECPAATSTVDTVVTQVSSFGSEATSCWSPITEAPTEQPRSPPTEESNTTTHLHNHETCSSDPPADYTASVKRSRPVSHGALQSQQKRVNAGDSDCDLSAPPELQPSEPSRLSQKFEIQDLEHEPANN